MSRVGAKRGDRFNRVCDRLIAMRQQVGLEPRVSLIVWVRLDGHPTLGRRRVLTLPRRNGR